MSGHLEALTGWRDLCGQLLNPIEEQQRGEAAPWSSSFVAVLWGRVYFLEKYSDYFPLPRSNYEQVVACCTHSSLRIVHFGHRAPSRPTLSGPGGRGSLTDL
jgi:hypothetical protein